MPRANPDVNYEISIHALLAESDRSLLLPVRGSRISIHALLAESDGGIKGYYTKGLQISIHALLAESDATAQVLWPPVKLFLSTLSLRRATFRVAVPEHVIVISIHALLAESD